MIKQILKEQFLFLKRIKNNFFGSYSYEKFIILTRSRTGSTFLKTLLDAHVNIEVHGELFRRLNSKKSKSIWDNVFSKKNKKTQWVGFKIFYYHPLDTDGTDVWEYLKDDENIKIIHLQRENLLRVHLSKLIAEKTDVWESRKKVGDEISEKRVHIDIDNMFADFKETEDWIKQAKLDFAKHEMLDVSYEELVADKDLVMGSIFKFLNVPKLDVKSKLSKQNPEGMKDLILNYDELEKSLSDSEYIHFIK